MGGRVWRGRSGPEAEFPATHRGPPALIPEVFQDYLSSYFNIFLILISRIFVTNIKIFINVGMPT